MKDCVIRKEGFKVVKNLISSKEIFVLTKSITKIFNNQIKEIKKNLFIFHQDM